MMRAIGRLPLIIKAHYIRFGYRALLFFMYAARYFCVRFQSGEDIWETRQEHPVFFGVIWLVLVIEMVRRLFPSKLESPGCQKQFARNYRSTGQAVDRVEATPEQARIRRGIDTGPNIDREAGNPRQLRIQRSIDNDRTIDCIAATPEQQRFRRDFGTEQTAVRTASNHGVLLTAVVWLVPNGIIGALYLQGIVDAGFMLLLSLAYAVCDLICILFFCPFQSWILKNRCCAVCRIYNWDYAMMVTPLIFVRSYYTRTLVFLALLILLRWELTCYFHPERFSEKTNSYLRCENCAEKLCVHKARRKST